MTLNILNFKKNNIKKKDVVTQNLTANEIALLRNRKSVLSAKSESRKLKETLESFEPTGFGLLYNYHAVNTAKLTPAGTLIPRVADFEELFFSIGESFDGSKSGFFLKGRKQIPYPAIKPPGEPPIPEGVHLPFWQSDLKINNDEKYMFIYPGGYRLFEETNSIKLGSQGMFATLDTYSDSKETRDFAHVLFSDDSNDASFYIPDLLGDDLPNILDQNFQRFTSVRCILDSSHYYYKTWYPGMYIEDIEKNKYGTIKIGNQIWLTSNLITKRYNDNSEIQSSYDNDYNAEIGAYAFPRDTEKFVGQSSKLN